jgi:DNA polymerase III subunit epsilon
MGNLSSDIFVCLDCESTGLDVNNDRIIEIALKIFTFDKTIYSFESLIDPQCDIPQESQEIHNITQDMVKNKPTIDKVLPEILSSITNHLIVGHGISFDISLISNEAKRNNIICNIHEAKCIDTLRMARLYGDSPINSLEKLRQHFNIPAEGAHRAMSDVTVNIAVFKHLSKNFNTTEQITERLKHPIALKTMPLGKHKGRKFDDIPIEYLYWAANKDFDEDLLYSIKIAIKNRKKRNSFNQASNPFSNL